MRNLIILLILFLCSSCAFSEPSVTDRTSSPFATELEKKKETKEKQEESLSEQQLGKEQPETDQGINNLKEDTEDFNQRLGKIISESSAEKKAQPQPSSSKNATGSDAQKVSFNFYDADLVEVVRVFMKLLDEDYMLHQDVSGRVSLNVDDSFSKPQIENLLRGILRINNMGMIKKENVWEIMPLSEMPRHVSSGDIIYPEQRIDQKRGQVIQGFRLHYISAQEMIQVIKPYLSKNAQVYAHEDKGILLVCDYPHTLRKISSLVGLFDESVFADKKAKVYALQYVDAEEAVEKLEQISEGFGLSKDKGGPRRRISFLPLQRLNMVLAIARDDKVLEFAESWVKQLDKEVPQSLQKQYGQNIFVYYVQYGEAQKIVESIRGLFQQRTVSEKEEEDEQVPKGSSRDTSQKVSEEAKALGATSGELTGPVTFSVDESTNSIITKCSSEDYQKVLSVIKKLDQYPKQVLIKVVIAEINLSDTSKLGVEWQYLLEHNDLEGNVSLNSRLGSPLTPDVDNPRITQGLSFFVSSTNRLKASIKAYADEGKAHILSTPTLLASDNQEATINIGEEVPIPTSVERKTEETSVIETYETTIQYRDTGIILKVTPQINKYGMVRMNISQEVSNLTDTAVQGVDAPVISNRNAQTSVSVNDQQTVVIGGLMRQNQESSFSGVPVLSKIPGLRNIFGYTEKSYSNTELIILITPHVVLDEEDSKTITREFKQRVKEMKMSMQY